MTLPRRSILRNLLALIAYGFTHPLPQPGRHPAAIHFHSTSSPGDGMNVPGPDCGGNPQCKAA